MAGDDVDLEAAAKVLGVHYQTAYRWVRSGLLPAVRVGSGYELSVEDVERLAEERRAGERRPDALAPDWHKAQQRLVEALTQREELTAQAVIDDALAAGATHLVLCDHLLVPVLRSLEADGNLLAAQVVAATELCERIAATLAAPPRGRPRGVAVVASPEGERNRVVSLMATVALRSARWRVHLLGADVPEGELIAFVRETDPDAVVLTVAARDASGLDVVDRLSSVLDAPVLVGNSALSYRALVDAVDRAVRSAES